MFFECFLYRPKWGVFSEGRVFFRGFFFQPRGVECFVDRLRCVGPGRGMAGGGRGGAGGGAGPGRGRGRELMGAVGERGAAEKGPSVLLMLGGLWAVAHRGHGRGRRGD